MQFATFFFHGKIRKNISLSSTQLVQKVLKVSLSFAMTSRTKETHIWIYMHAAWKGFTFLFAVNGSTASFDTSNMVCLVVVEDGENDIFGI